jgi:ATP synthase F1 subcomplex beta subunit 
VTRYDQEWRILMAGATGVVTDIICVVLNAKFPEDQTPEIYNALEIPLGNGQAPDS